MYNNDTDNRHPDNEIFVSVVNQLVTNFEM